ncbi:hypothetical protein [Gordonia aurantiaca]|uniref:hypothetical protein n=1 Tax=Gordonia sp. B21 TaxID=3151852 RepID=UPI003267D348
MSKDSEPESRPISVSELLARSQADGSLPSTRRDGRGRRRAGRDGSVTVSALTGEIPKITDPSTPRANRARPVSADSAPKTSEPKQSEPRRSGAKPSEAETSGAETSEAKISGAKTSGAKTRSPGPADAATRSRETATPEPENPESRPEALGIETPKAETPKAEAPGAEASTWSFGSAPSGPFPRSADPTPRRAADDRPSARFPRADTSVADSAGFARPDGPSTSRTASGMPGFGDVPLATRDFSADAVARRLGRSRATAPDVDDESANAVTGIIPVVDGPESDTDLTVVESDDVVTYRLDEVDGTEVDGSGVEARERGDAAFDEVMDFDAYRNFADVEGDEEVVADDEGGKGLAGLARKLFGRKKSADKSGAGRAAVSRAASAKAAAVPGGTADAARGSSPDDRDDNPTEILDPIATGGQPRTPGSVAAGADTATNDTATNDTATNDTATNDTATNDTDETAAGETETWQASAQWYDTEAWAAPVVDEDDTQPPGETGGEVAADAQTGSGSDARTELVETADLDETGRGEDRAVPETVGRPAVDLHKDDVTDVDKDDGEDHEGGKAEQVATAETATADADEEKHEPSPAVAWLMVIGQAILGLAVGVGLFWGFTELWRWNPYFALVLAVLVIFGIVTLSHVVRRTRDLATTLLALGVGLLVTIGPLVLLAT